MIVNLASNLNILELTFQYFSHVLAPCLQGGGQGGGDGQQDFRRCHEARDGSEPCLRRRPAGSGSLDCRGCRCPGLRGWPRSSSRRCDRGVAVAHPERSQRLVPERPRQRGVHDCWSGFSARHLRRCNDDCRSSHRDRHRSHSGSWRRRVRRRRRCRDRRLRRNSRRGLQLPQAEQRGGGRGEEEQ